MGRLCGFLVLVELYDGLRVLAAAFFHRPEMAVCISFAHSALPAILIILVDQAPGKELAHAVMQMDGGPHRGGKVDKS